jgi:hypothetical protein
LPEINVNLALIIYLISIADTVLFLSKFLATTSGLAWIACFTGHKIGEINDAVAKASYRLLGSIFIVTFIITALTPNQKTAYQILAAYGVDQAVASEYVQRVAPKSLELLEDFLDNNIGGSKNANTSD